MQQTPNYNLPQFEGTDFFNKEALNDAFIKIDTGISDLQETINNASGATAIVQEVVGARKGKASLEEKIGDIDTNVENLKNKSLELQGELEKHNSQLEQSTFLLKNKKVVAYGDSITWGQKAPAGVRSEYPWTRVFQEITKCNIDNRAIAGTCMAEGFGYGMTEELNSNAFCNRVDREDFSNIDIIFLAYGTNDYGYVIELGNINDTVKTTFYGALNYSIKKLLSLNHKIKIVLLTPMFANTTYVLNQKSYTMYDYVTAIKNIANKYKLSLVNLHEGFGVNEINIGSMYWDELHPTDETYIKIGEYIAKQYPFNSSIGLNEIKNTLPLLAPNNMIRYGDFPITGHRNLFNDLSLEGGVSFKLLPNNIKETYSRYNIKPNTIYNITFSAKYKSDSLLTPQKLQVDIYGDSILCYSSVNIGKGENKYIVKLKTPSDTNIDKKYKLRFSALNDNIDEIYVSAVCFSIGDIAYGYIPANGEKEEKRWNNIVLKTGTSPNNTLAYYKDAEGFVHFRGLLSLDTNNLFTTLPDEFRPTYDVTTLVMSNDGTTSFCVITKSGDVSIGIGNKTYDLSSIPPFYAGEVERY